MSLEQVCTPPELASIDQALRSEDAFLIFPRQNGDDGGFTVATIRDPESKTQHNLAHEPTALKALVTGVRLRLAERGAPLDSASSPPDPRVLTELTSWLATGRWLEATRDSEQIAVTLHDYQYEEGGGFIREGSMSGMMTEIIGYKEPRLYPVRTMQRGFGTTFWQATAAAFATTPISV